MMSDEVPFVSTLIRLRSQRELNDRESNLLNIVSTPLDYCEPLAKPKLSLLTHD